MPANRTIAIFDAPSNLGLRPPAQGVPPGAYKLAGALRDQRILDRLGARDAGVAVPPRYVPDTTNPLVTRNEDAIAGYALTLASRIDAILDVGEFPLMLGGDCSILLGPALALRRRGRYGLIYIDGHGDFRHPGNAEHVGAAAGEDLAIVTGRGTNTLANIDNLSPYVEDADVVVLGIRDEDGGREDGWLAEITRAGIFSVTSRQVQGRASEAAATALQHLDRPEIDGYWLHVDADVLDAALMPAVDSAEPDGIDWDDLAALLATLVNNDRAIGMQITIFDPDLDPDGSLAARLTDTIAGAFANARQQAEATV